MNIISSSNNRKLPVVTLKQLSTTNSQQQQQQQSSIDATINKIATSSSSSIMDDYDESRILKSLSDETKHQSQQQSIQNGCILDDSLTSLTWLQNLNLLKANNAKNNTTNNNSTNSSSVIASTAVNDSTINNKNMNSESTPTLAASKTSTTTTTTTCVTEFPVVMNDQTSTQSSNSFALIGISYPPLSPPLSVQCSPNSTNSSSNHSTTKTTTTLNTNMTAINTPNKFAKTTIGMATKSNNAKSGYSRANGSGTTVKKIKQAVLSSSVSSKKAGEAISTNQSTTSSPSAAFHSDSNAKPPYSYSQLIVLSMRESRASKMTLQMIYDWIIDNFGYFRKADPNWQVTFKNSIRHNLSLNKCFKKIARQKDEPGKGGFWTLDEEYKKQLLCNERSPTTSSVVVGESAATNESDAVATNTTMSSTTTTTSTAKDGQLASSTMETMQSLKRRRKSPKSENPRQPKSTIRKMDEQKSSGGGGTSKAKKLKTAALKHSMSVPDGKQSTPSSSEASTNSTLEANNSYLAPFSTNASNTNTNNISSLQLQQNSSWQQQQQQHTHQHHHNHQHHPSCHQSSFTCSCGGMNGGYSTYNSYFGQQQTSTPSYNRSMTCCTSMPSSSTNLYHSHHHQNPQNHHPHMVDDLSNTFSSSFGHEIIKSMDDDVEATAAGLFNFEQALECNFDLDPLTSSQAPVHSSVATQIPTNDMSNHHHIQHHSIPPSVHPLNRFQHQSTTTQQQTVDTHQNTTTTTDVELNELFEYTSQFSNTMSQQNGVSQNNGGDYLSYLSAPNAYDMLGGEANSQGGSTTSSSGAESPLDQVSKARLDLTIQGHGIKQPKWWMDSLITSGNNDPLNNSHSQSASSTTSFHFIDLDNNLTGSDLLGMPSKRDAADECDSASMFINTASLCYDVDNQASVTSTGDKELLSSSLAAAVDGKDII